MAHLVNLCGNLQNVFSLSQVKSMRVARADQIEKP
jgi:hypothetical protein